MPLRLVTGPANAAKAGEVLGGLRARLDEDPVLLVPSFQDVEHAQRELAERGAVFGARVLRFERLYKLVADRVGYRERVVSDVQRDLLLEAAVERARLEVLAESAAGAGFIRAAARLVSELGAARVDPGRFTQALRAWAGDGPRRAYAEEVASVYGGYRRALDEAGLVDSELFAWRALDALRLDPARWDGAPVYVYGFDDFTVLELDALETIAVRCGAQVVVSLPFEPGREAFRATAAVHARLSELADERVELAAVDEHYDPGSRAALHHVERNLFETDPGEPVEAGAAIAFHSAGGARAEVELAAARVLELLRGGTAPGDVAVVFRSPASCSSLVEQVFGAYGVPYSLDRSVPFAHTGLGRGVLALIRCAAGSGGADDLLAYLRTPGLVREPALTDRLEAELRQEGAHDAERARAIWERGHWELSDLDRLRDAPDVGAYLTELRSILARLFAGPYKRRAAVLKGPELDDPRVFATGRDALEELTALAEAGAPVDRGRVERVLAALEVHVGDNPQPDRVHVARPEEIRARRFEAVLLLGLQEGEFPGGARPEPFLPDDVRRDVASASGLVLPLREDRIDRERYLFYVCASRAERLLVLSSRTSDEEGTPEARSFFVEDVHGLLAGEPGVRERSLGEVTWAPDDAPTAAEWDRALAARGPKRAERLPGQLEAAPLLAYLGERGAISASWIERFADCPVKWLVESVLRPDALEPDPEQLVRGQLAHEVLEHTFRRVAEETGSRAVTPANLERAERILLEELEARASSYRISPSQTRVRAAARRLEFDLLRHLSREAERDGSFEPHSLELRFGDGEGDEYPPVEIEEGLMVSGRIDRVDTSNGQALVIDYKSGKNVESYKVASWESENRFQAALYMLAVERLLGKRAVGGVYVALGAKDPRPRGMLAKEADGLGSGWVGTDLVAEPEFEEKLAWARDRIRETVAAIRAGELECKPDSCAYRGGCSYPSLCRCER
ncbi:MAG: exodeoxyribonuclease V subunit gamma [Thermoleophilaceae bacterium]|nr:exodeoxyribonuclease V subunit gamma [Thermoleophilaceae bacterium]